ncbi:MAG: hypothetical protein KAS30_02630, partial [Candidatus Diapherotrites archaeon]|nr:hypothetical protein [Candidatus Diapherotrites archaeon]
MANPIQNKQLADALNEINSLGKSIEQTFKGISDQAKKVGESSEDLAKNLDFSRSKDIKMVDQLLQDLTKRVDKLTESIKNREKATDILTKQEKTLIRLQKEQNESTQELAVSIEEVKLERQKATKAAKEQAKENKGLTLTLDKQRKRLNELQRELTNAAVEGKLNEESIRDQREEFEKLFKTVTEAEQQFGNFRRQVGNYEKASEEATRATEKLGEEIDKIKKLSLALGATIGAGGLVGKALKTTEEGFDDLRVGTEAFDTAVNTLLAGAVKGLSDGFSEADKDGTLLGIAFSSIIGAIKGIADESKNLKTVIETQAELTRATIEYEKSLLDAGKASRTVFDDIAEFTGEKNPFRSAEEGGQGLLTILADQVEQFEILTLE